MLDLGDGLRPVPDGHPALEQLAGELKLVKVDVDAALGLSARWACRPRKVIDG